MIFINNKYTKWYFNIILHAKSRISNIDYYEIHHIIPKSLNGDNSNENLVKLTAREHFICHLLLTKMTYGKYKRNMNFAFWILANKTKHTNDNNAYNFNINSRIYQTAKENFVKENSITHKNKTLSQDTKDKISKANKGKKLSKEHKAKIDPTGRRHTEDTKRALSKKQKEDYASGARIHGMLGKTHSDETKRKISIGNRGKIMPKMSQERKKEVSRQFLGTTQSNEHISKRISSRTINGYYKDVNATKEKMSISAKNRPRLVCQCGRECTAPNFKRWHGENCKIT